MATYSIDLREEYKALDSIEKLKIYFETNHPESIHNLSYIQNRLITLEETIIDKLKKIIKQYGSIILKEGNINLRMRPL